MPSPGDQHRDTAATANPFVEPERRISEYSAQEIATLASRLEKQLGPEYLSSRPGASGQKVHYLAAEKCINLANEIFGFNGWSSCIKNIQIDFVDESASGGKISLGLSVIVRVTLRDGTYHEDIGYGHIENCKGKAAAFEKAKKEGTTDALKRALRNFGNVLGNCIYDKDYLAKVTRVKCAPSRWDPENLHRHPDYAPTKKDPEGNDKKQNGAASADQGAPALSGEEHFGGEDFDEADFSEGHVRDHPDEVLLDPVMLNRQAAASGRTGAVGEHRQLRQPNFRPESATTPTTTTEPRQFRAGAAAGNGAQSAAAPGGQQHGATGFQQQQHQQQPRTPGPPQRGVNRTPMKQMTAGAESMQNSHQRIQREQPQADPQGGGAKRPPADAPVGFYPASLAPMLQEAETPVDAPLFNPHAESPSIRRTSGIDHSRSKPINRDTLGASLNHHPPPHAQSHHHQSHQQAAGGVTSAGGPPPAAAAVAAGRGGVGGGGGGGGSGGGGTGVGGSASGSGPATSAAADVTNPQLNVGRKIGMPGICPSPLQNRAQYKPPGPATSAAGVAVAVAVAPGKRTYDGVGVAHNHNNNNHNHNHAPLHDLSVNAPRINYHSNSNAAAATTTTTVTTAASAGASIMASSGAGGSGVYVGAKAMATPLVGGGGGAAAGNEDQRYYANNKRIKL